MRHPLTDATNLREPVGLLGKYRLMPLREVKDGEIFWCDAENKALGVSRPGSVIEPPNGTTTACLSIAGFRIITAEIAFFVERSCQ